jgi:hypothetical protein
MRRAGSGRIGSGGRRYATGGVCFAGLTDGQFAVRSPHSFSPAAA